MKTLVCILCQVREGDLTWPNFKKNVIDELGADLALCISSDSYVRASGKIIGQASEDNEFFKEAKYIFRYQEPDDWATAWDEMTGGTWRPLASVIPGDWLGGVKEPVEHKTSGAIGTFYRWFLAKKLKENKITGLYDQVIITRSDYLWVKPHPVLDLDHVWVPNGEFHGGITDRHMVLPSNLVDEFLGIGGTLGPEHYQPFINYFMNRQWCRHFMVNLEGYLWFMYTWRNIHTKIAFFPQKMYTINKNGPKYPDEVDNTKIDEGLVTWPWAIDHTFISKNGMFCGKLKAL
jgi:hypothetical protein